MRKFNAIVLVVSVLFFVSNAFAAGKLELPWKPKKNATLTIMTPYGPGGSTDYLAAHLKFPLDKILGTRSKVEFRPGARTIIGFNHFVKQPADGSVIIVASSPTFEAQSLQPGANYKVEDFVGLAAFSVEPFGIFVKSDSPFNSLKDVREYSKKNPGKLSSAGVGKPSTAYFTYEALRTAGIDISYVPMDTGAEIRTAVYGGHVDLGYTGFARLPHLRKIGECKILGVSSRKRHHLASDVPTVEETLGVRLNAQNVRGFVIRSAAPKEVVEAYRMVLAEISKDEELMRILDRKVTYGFMSGEKFTEHLYETVKGYRKHPKPVEKK